MHVRSAAPQGRRVWSFVWIFVLSGDVWCFVVFGGAHDTLQNFPAGAFSEINV